jgi:hypothetical protein
MVGYRYFQAIPGSTGDKDLVYIEDYIADPMIRSIIRSYYANYTEMPNVHTCDASSISKIIQILVYQYAMGKTGIKIYIPDPSMEDELLNIGIKISSTSAAWKAPGYDSPIHSVFVLNTNIKQWLVNPRSWDQIREVVQWNEN